MLGFERRVVAALTGATDLEQRRQVERFVDGTLTRMPEVLRAGVAVGSLGLGTLARVADVVGPRSHEATPGDPVLARFERFGPARQYFRFFRSLVVFAEHETAAEPST